MTIEKLKQEIDTIENELENIIINSEKIESKHVKPGWVPRDG